MFSEILVFDEQTQSIFNSCNISQAKRKSPVSVRIRTYISYTISHTRLETDNDHHLEWPYPLHVVRQYIHRNRLKDKRLHHMKAMGPTSDQQRERETEWERARINCVWPLVTNHSTSRTLAFSFLARRESYIVSGMCVVRYRNETSFLSTF